MWMRGCNDGADQFNTIQDSFSGRKLRPLMPKPIYGHDLLTPNHHLATAEQNKISATHQQVVVTSRWNPTPEQLQTLEELYRRGTRTPSAEQIQQITAELRRYGKIEGKNVFYWFQNHKARERQKRRRQLESPSDKQGKYGDKKELSNASTGANRRAIEVEQTKNWVSPTNPRTMAEKTVSTQGAPSAAKGAEEAESKGADRWLQFDEDAAESQQAAGGRNATWRMAQLCYSPLSPATLRMNSPLAAAANTPAVQTTASTMLGTDQLDTKRTNDFIDIFAGTLCQSIADGRTEAQTLQLFPLPNHKEEEDEVEAMSAANDVANYQFFEFLPLKN